MTTPRDRAAPDDVRITGAASAEEVAAVLAVVARRAEPVPVDPVRRWRRLRQSVSSP